VPYLEYPWIFVKEKYLTTFRRKIRFRVKSWAWVDASGG